MRKISLIKGFIAFCLASSLLAQPAMAADYEALRQGNGGKLAEQHSFLPTTERAVILTFGGLSKELPLHRILDYMQRENLRGTFFVTEREIARNGGNIALIKSYGQELALGLTPLKEGRFEDYCAQLERLSKALTEKYGGHSKFVRIMSGGGDLAVMQEAVSAMGYTLAGQGLSAVQGKHKEVQSASEVMADIFGRWTTSLNAGEIVYMRTDFYANDSLAAEVLQEIKEKKVDNIGYVPLGASGEPVEASAYRLVSLGDVMAAVETSYKPVEVDRLAPEMQPEYGRDRVTEENFREELFSRYIGAPEVLMMGFSRSELARLDKTGLVKNAPEKTVFLTFDDWGHDDSVSKVLYVLRKHHVNGTFFIITKNVLGNPNLLRAIAADGNEIGSHTNNHAPMVRRDERGHQVPVETAEEYREDVESSYPQLLAVLGDMKLPSGRPALTRMLRPPTLAISRDGCKTILNAGFEYIVNGYGSTEDYGAVSLQSLTGIMNNLIHDEKGSVRRGAILIMHMTTAAKYTPKALDILLTANDKLPEGHPGKFKVALLGDYLTDGYDQRMKMAKP